MIKAVTHHHPKFLKEAYKLDGTVDLVNDERYIPHGERYIGFNPDTQHFIVYIKSIDRSMRVRGFNDMISAVNCARRA
jgi:hypothetical protein